MTTEVQQRKIDPLSKLNQISYDDFKQVIRAQKIALPDEEIRQIYDNKQRFTISTVLGITKSRAEKLKREEESLIFDVIFLGDRDKRGKTSTSGIFMVVNPVRDEKGNRSVDWEKNEYSQGDLIELYMKDASLNVKGSDTRFRPEFGQHIKVAAFWNEFETQNGVKGYSLNVLSVIEQLMEHVPNFWDLLKFKTPQQLSLDDLWQPVALKGMISFVGQTPKFEDRKLAGRNTMVYHVNDQARLSVQLSCKWGENYSLQSSIYPQEYAIPYYDLPDPIEEILAENDEEVIKSVFNGSRSIHVGIMTSLKESTQDREIVTYISLDTVAVKVLAQQITIGSLDESQWTNEEITKNLVGDPGPITDQDIADVIYGLQTGYNDIYQLEGGSGMPYAKLQKILQQLLFSGTIIQPRTGYFELLERPNTQPQQLQSVPPSQPVQQQNGGGSKVDRLKDQLEGLVTLLGPDADIKAIKESNMLDDEFSDLSDNIIMKAWKQVGGHS